MQPTVDRGIDTLMDSASRGRGLATIYSALDQLVEQYALRDAAVVVDVPDLGRQMFRAGRSPLHNDEQGLRDAGPGLYLDPPVVEAQAVGPLMVAMSALALRFDALVPVEDTAT
jgi:hypothetical protein